MDVSDWHLGLRAWNVGEPPTNDGHPLSALEAELTACLEELYRNPPSGPLLGPDGILPALVASALPNLVEAHPALAERAFVALADETLGRREGDILDALSDAIRDHARTLDWTALAKRTSNEVSLGIIGINLAVGTGTFRCVVTTFWAIATAARAGLSIAPRERSAELFSFEREVKVTCAGYIEDSLLPLQPTRLEKHLFADMLKARRRQSAPQPE